MSIRQYDSGPTSNDLLESLISDNTPVEVNYQVVAQCAEEIENIENAPAVSMRPYLIKSGQKSLLTTISIYSLPGERAEQIRFLYMNPEAIRVWEEMGKVPRIIGAQVRPLTQLSSRLVSLSANRRSFAASVPPASPRSLGRLSRSCAASMQIARGEFPES